MTNSSNNKDGNQTMDTTNKTNEPTQQTANQTPGTTETVIQQTLGNRNVRSRGIFIPQGHEMHRPHLHMEQHRPQDLNPDWISYKPTGRGNNKDLKIEGRRAYDNQINDVLNNDLIPNRLLNPAVYDEIIGWLVRYKTRWDIP